MYYTAKRAEIQKRYRSKPEVKVRMAEQEKARRKQDPDRYLAIWRKSHYKQAYGISANIYDHMLAQQNGGCAICGSTNHKTRFMRFCVDHNHTTGEVRGLLCASCNMRLGWYEKYSAQIQKHLTKRRVMLKAL